LKGVYSTVTISYHFTILLCIKERLEQTPKGSPFHTVILSDHKNLTYFRSPWNLNWWQAWWSLFLSEFNLKLIHTPGSKMIQSDALSHWSDHVFDDNDNEDVIILPDDIFIKLIDLNLLKEIKEKTEHNNFFAKALLALKENSPLPITSKLTDWFTNNGLLFFKDRCYIPPDKDLHDEITKKYHDTLSSGHPRN
jgi:hypothetical protein